MPKHWRNGWDFHILWYKKRLVGETQSQSVHLLLGKWRLSYRRETQTLAVDKRPQGPSVSDSWCDPETPGLSKDSEMQTVLWQRIK